MWLRHIDTLENIGAAILMMVALSIGGVIVEAIRKAIRGRRDKHDR